MSPQEFLRPAVKSECLVGGYGAAGVRCLDPRLRQARVAIADVLGWDNLGARLLVPAVDGVRVPMRLMANMTAMSNDPR